MSVIDKDEIVAAAVAGLPIAQNARRNGCSRREVVEVLNEYAAMVLLPSSRAAAVALSAARVDQLSQRFLRRAVEDGDVAAGVLVVKCEQRKSALLGLDQPQSVKMDLAVSVVEHEQTSTERMRGMLDSVLGITCRERQLLDQRELEGDRSPDVLAEINELREARGQPPLEPDEQAATE